MLTGDGAVWPDEDLCRQGLEPWGLRGSALQMQGGWPWIEPQDRPSSVGEPSGQGPALRLSPAGLQALRGGVW